MTGDPALPRQLKASLQKLRAGVGGPALAEMAREVLEGRTTLRDVARSSAYAAEMSAVMAGLQQWNADLTDEQASSSSRTPRLPRTTPTADRGDEFVVAASDIKRSAVRSSEALS